MQSVDVNKLRALLEAEHAEFVALVHKTAVEGILLHEAGYETEADLLLLGRMIKFATAHGLEVTVIPSEERNRFRRRVLTESAKGSVN